MSDAETPSNPAVYASPGADDTYLRPKAGQAFAPRRVAACLVDDAMWLAWIHYQAGTDHLVVTCKHRDREGDLVTLCSGPEAVFSLPALLSRTPDPEPVVFCACSRNGRIAIHVYAKRSDVWQCVTELSTRLCVIRHLDVIADGAGNAYLAYSGLAPDAQGLSVCTRQYHEGRWAEEIPHEFPSTSVNRPKLVMDGHGKISVIADAYAGDRFDIAWKPLSAGRHAKWMRVSTPEGSNLFPSIAADANGDLWASWLHQYPVRREDVMGLWQEARVARRVGSRWCEVPGTDGPAAACLNLGLLPIRRYFGYDGLRRYPRLAATEDGAVWLLWEQQKDEEEIWENVSNGFLCAKRYAGGAWSDTLTLTDTGACHAFDEKSLHASHAMAVALKAEHRASGDDFVVRQIDLDAARPSGLRPASAWQDWRVETLPKPRRPRRRTAADLSVYWGDLHCHSWLSPDAEGEPDGLYLFARDLAGLDFVCLTDNDFYPHKALLASEVAYAAALADALTRKGDFVALSGFEWTYHRDDAERSFNHRIVIFAGDRHDVFHRNETTGNTEDAFMGHIRQSGYLSIPHHAYWRMGSIPNECAVEVTSAWGTYILDAPTVHQALAAGARVGFTGNSDSHRFLPGLSGALTGVYATELSRQGIVDALRKRRCFATTGNRTAIDFRINEAFMGEALKTNAIPTLFWRVHPHETIEKVQVIRDGELVFRSEETEGEWTDESAGAEPHWYYLQVKEKGAHARYPHNVAPAWGKWAWSSPIWVDRP